MFTNGNIAHTVNSLQPFGGWNSTLQQGQVLAQVYRYDQLNRLKTAQGVEGLTMAANSWDGEIDAVTTRFRSEYTYDENGNIGTTKRWDEAGAQYDALNYHYETSGTELLRNRLYHLNETLDGGYGDIGVDANPFETAHDLINTNAYNNYNYDKLGNLVKDTREGIAGIEWTVAGKVKHITRPSGSTQPELWFNYGADGQRTSKTVGDPGAGGYREYYIRDAQGNIMATYRYTNNGSASLKVTDRPMYGSKRLGSYTRPMELAGEEYPGTFMNYVQPMNTRLLHYELNDHLGNVTAVVTGRLLDGASAGSPKQAELLSAQGYEAFGSLLPGRNYSSDAYRCGFQGQIKDDEVYGATGASYAFEYRMHDARVGRFWSIDPLVAKYAWNSPYAFSANRVIDAIEREGLEALLLQSITRLADGRLLLKIIPDDQVAKNASVPFQFRIPASLSSTGAGQVFFADALGSPNFGYQQIQTAMAGFQKIQDDIYMGDKLLAYGVEASNSTSPGADISPFIKGIVVNGLTPNRMQSVDIPIQNSLPIVSGDFQSKPRVQSFSFTAPPSSSDVKYTFNTDDMGIANTFTFTDADGNPLGSSTGRSGVVNFTLQPGQTFNMTVTGNPSAGAADQFGLDGTVTTTTQARVVPRP